MASADLSARGKINPPTRACHALGNGHRFNPQPIEANIEIGQQRRLGIDDFKCWRSPQGRAAQGERADIKHPARPRERPPIERSFRNCKKPALRITEGDLTQYQVGKQRSLDPSNPDAQTRCWAISRNLVCHQPVAERRIEHKQRADQHPPDRRQQERNARAPARP